MSLTSPQPSGATTTTASVTSGTPAAPSEATDTTRPERFFLQPKFTIDNVNFYYGDEMREQLTREAVDFDFRPTDVLIAGYPRSGTTLCRQLTWLICNHGNVELARSSSIQHRVPLLDRAVVDRGDISAVQRAREMGEGEATRIIATNLPYHLLPKAESAVAAGMRVVYMIRNPKDVLISTHHLRLFFRPLLGDHMTNIPFHQLVHLMMQEPDRGNIIDHVLSYWKHRNNQDRFCFINFEDTVRDYKSTINKISHFLHVSLNEKQTADILHFIDLPNFKAHQNHEASKSVGRDANNKEMFVREGAVGGWKDRLKGELNHYVDDCIKLRLGGEHVPFIYE